MGKGTLQLDYMGKDLLPLSTIQKDFVVGVDTAAITNTINKYNGYYLLNFLVYARYCMKGLSCNRASKVSFNS